MLNIIAIAFSAFLIENIILTQFLGICPFLGVSKKRSSAVGMGLAVVFVIILSSIVTFGLYHLVLVKLEMAYVIGRDRLDDDLKRFVNDETLIDGITAFSFLVMYLYEKYLASGFWDIYEFLTYEYEKYYELFKKECFVEVD